MAEQSTAKSLDVREDRPFQEKLWIAQRVGWTVMLLFLIAVALGATGGGGPLAMARVETAAGMIEYPRVARWQGVGEMTISLPPSASGDVELELSDSLLNLFKVESVSPTPSEESAIPGGHRLTFQVGEGRGPKTIVFHLRAARPALPTAATARLGDSDPVPMRFTILP